MNMQPTLRLSLSNFTGLVAEVHPDVTITTVHKIMRDRLKLLWRRHLVTE